MASTQKKYVAEASPWFALTDAATITVDASVGNNLSVTLGGNRTMGNPSNSVDGQKIIFRIKQSGSGSNTMSWSSNYRFSSDLPSPTLSTGANKVDYIAFIYHATDGKWDCIGQNRGF